MTTAKALATAQKLWGKTGAVESRKNGAYIGEHDEFVESFQVVTEWSNRTSKKQNPVGQYRCQLCDAYHLPKSRTSYYAVGKIMLGMFFEVRGTGASFEDAFKAAEAFDNRFKVARA